MLRHTHIWVIPILYINTHLVSCDGGFWYIHKDNLGSRFVPFSMVLNEESAESGYMFGSDCFVATATRDIAINDGIILYAAGTNVYVIESRGSLCKL